MRAWFSLLLLFPVFSNAADVEYKTAKFEYTVADDLSMRKHTVLNIQFNSEQIINQEKQQVFNWRSDLGEFEIIKAETQKLDGSVRPVPENAIIRQSGAIGQYSYRDRASMMLPFPDLAVGDSIGLETVLRTKSDIPGQFLLVQYFRENAKWNDAEIKIVIPASHRLYLDTLGVQLVEDKIENGQRHLRWTYSNSKIRLEKETRLIDVDGRIPHIYATTLNSWDELAQLYAPQYREKTAATPEIAALAQSLVVDAATPQKKTQAIYDWVRKNIRYVASYLGDGGMVPHDAAWVFVNRYGDCKDHAILLEAMLRSVGVESSPVFISNGTTERSLPKVVVWAFNHAITYVPELDLYLDSTAALTPFGELPPGDQDRPVLRVYEKTVLSKTPMASVEKRLVTRKTNIKVAEDGSAVVETQIENGADRQGWMNELAQTLEKSPNAKVWAEKRMKDLGWQGSARAKLLSDGNGFTMTLRPENWLKVGEIGTAEFTNAHPGGFSLLDLAGDFLVDKREKDFECWPNSLKETMSLKLPKSFELLALPRNQKIEAPGLTFTAEYHRAGNKIERTLDFVWAPQQTHCPASEWKTYHEAFRKIRQAVETGVAYRRPVDQNG